MLSVQLLRHDRSPLASLLIRSNHDGVVWFEMISCVLSQFMHCGEVAGRDLEDFRNISQPVKVAVNCKKRCCPSSLQKPGYRCGADCLPRIESGVLPTVGEQWAYDGDRVGPHVSERIDQQEKFEYVLIRCPIERLNCYDVLVLDVTMNSEIFFAVRKTFDLQLPSFLAEFLCDFLRERLACGAA